MRSLEEFNRELRDVVGPWGWELRPMEFDIPLDDDGEEVPGCTDPEASNFNPLATVDDGSCTYDDLGACCDGEICTDDTTEETCAGTFHLGLTCAEDPCTLGACCDGSSCVDTVEDDCDGTWLEAETCLDDVCLGTCCEDGYCYYDTETNCEVSGTFLGYDVTCADDREDGTSTNCPPPSISIICDSITTSREKCGFPSLNSDDPNKRWKTSTYSRAATTEATFYFAQFPDLCSVSVSGSFSEETVSTFTTDPDGTCVYNPGTCTGGGFLSTVLDSDEGNCGPEDICSGHGGESGGIGPCDGSHEGFNFFTGAFAKVLSFCSVIFPANPTSYSMGVIVGVICSDTTSTSTTKVTHCSYGPLTLGSPPTSGSDQDSTWDESYVLADEYTTEELEDLSIAALPEYSGIYGCPEDPPKGPGQGCLCSSARTLSEDETELLIRRFKFKFTFLASSIGFTIHWTETSPDGDFDDSESISAGATESSVHEIFEPDDNGTVTITDIYTTV